MSLSPSPTEYREQVDDEQGEVRLPQALQAQESGILAQHALLDAGLLGPLRSHLATQDLLQTQYLTSQALVIGVQSSQRGLAVRDPSSDITDELSAYRRALLVSLYALL